MSILDPDSSTAHRFQRDRLAHEIFVGLVIRNGARNAGNFLVFARRAFMAADTFLAVKKTQPPIIPAAVDQKPNPADEDHFSRECDMREFEAEQRAIEDMMIEQEVRYV